MSREHFITTTFSLTALALIASAGFEQSVRNEILKKEHSCGICGNQKSLTVHHIVPDSLENGKDNQSPKNSIDPYVKFFQEVYKEEILPIIPPGILGDFRRAVKKRINSQANGVVLCMGCHRRLHQNFNPNYDKNFFDSDLGYNLSEESLVQFMLDKIINPALRDLSLDI